jgi:hypothetical protein
MTSVITATGPRKASGGNLPTVEENVLLMADPHHLGRAEGISR